MSEHSAGASPADEPDQYKVTAYVLDEDTKHKSAKTRTTTWREKEDSPSEDDPKEDGSPIFATLKTSSKDGLPNEGYEAIGFQDAIPQDSRVRPL
jgi:hypothetical protein